MRVRRDLAGVVVALALLPLSPQANGGEDIRLQGSVSAADALRSVLSDGFTARFGDVELLWESAGSGAAFVALFSGDADVGVVSRSVRAEEVNLASRLGLELKETILALDGLAVVVHPRNDVPSLSLEQLESLYAGRIVRWLGFGGVDEAVQLLSLTASSGTPSEFCEIVFQDPMLPFASSIEYLVSSAEILERVASERGAVGFVSMSYDRSRVRTVPIVEASGRPLLPSAATVSDGTYPLRYPLRLYTVADPQDELQHFLRFLYLHDGPGLVAAAGLVPVQAFAAVTRSAARARQRAQVSVTRIDFGFRGARLDADARRDLTEMASRLAGSEEGVWITGHEEPTEARDELAATRSRTVAEFLEGQNIDPSRMTVDSRGASEPLASNAELEGRRSNRRVDVWVLPH
ncbi:MAG: hypothetical protein BMS9Abin37_1887 [Acidobacteriota bacterium]|nr:MAG: hypothetical protein BMS9Abin37_1887 [Acidobacteriota bacterium]